MTDIVEGKVLPPAVERDPTDPPGFFLQASPTWAPWLPDGVWQRVPVGSTGQVLTVNADGSIGWSNSSAGFTNPMSQTGDLITSNPGSTPVALHIGTSGQILAVVAGVPAWITDTGLVSPMTTQGDIIVQGASAAGRLGIGTNNQVLTSNGTTATWANAAAGFADPTTTAGDMIIKNAVPTTTRLGIGAANQVLTVDASTLLPSWKNSASGFANPMTAAGDMIYGLSLGTATRLPIGANGLVLTVVQGNPAWAAGATGASAVVFPSNDTLGNQDRIAIMNADAGLAKGGEIILGPGAFYVKPASGNNCLVPRAQTVVAPQGSTLAGSPVCIRGVGAGTIIYPVGTGVTGIYYHRTTSYGIQFGRPAQPTVGYLRDFVLDGSLALGASTGLDNGDGWGYEIDLRIVNFTGAGARGFVLAQDVFWCEKGDYKLELINNSTAAYMTTRLGTTGDHSHEYNRYWFSIFCNSNQQGVVCDGVNDGGSELWMRGNMANSSSLSGPPTGNVAALSIINAVGQTANDAHRWYLGEIHFKVEANQGDGPAAGVSPYDFYSDGAGRIQICTGRIVTSSLTPGNMNGAEFTFRGIIADAVLAQLVTGPNGSASTYANHPVSTSNGSANVTLTDGATGYAVGSAVMFVPPAPGGGFSIGVIYYVVSQSANVITLATTPGGTAITASTTSSGTLDPIGPPVPASGTIQQNYGPDCMVYVTGGTGVSITIQASPAPYSASVQNPYYIPAGGALTVTYTTAPTWNWIPCSQSQY